MSTPPSESSELLSSSQRHQLYRWARDSDADVVLVCAAAPDQRFPRHVTPIVLPGCVGEDPSLAAAVQACGARRVRVLPCRAHNSELCAHGAEVYEPGNLPVLRAAEYVDATHMPIGRRALLGLRALASEEIPVDSAASLSSRLVQAHRALGSTPDVSMLIDTPALAVQNCQACGICTKMCPTQALHLEISGGQATLSQDTEACTGEFACVSSCPYDAIYGEGQLRLADVLADPVRTLSSFEVADCQRCGAAFPAEEAAGDGQTEKTMCPTCHRKFENPFSSWLPPGFQR